MARLRYDGVETTLGAAITTTSETSITFAGPLQAMGVNIPTVSGGNYLTLVIDDEIVWLTAYTSGATTGTVTREAENTTAATHLIGARVVHGPTVADFDYIASPLNTPGDLLVYGDNSVANGTPTGSVITINNPPVSTEQIVPGMDLQLPGPVGTSVTVDINLWVSMNEGGGGKVWTIRLRRTNASGAILTSNSSSGTVDSSDGHNRQWLTSYNDTSPTDGHYVVTFQNTGGGTTSAFSDTRIMTVTSSGNAPTRLPSGADGTVLVADSSEDLGLKYGGPSDIDGLDSYIETVTADHIVGDNITKITTGPSFPSSPSLGDLYIERD